MVVIRTDWDIRITEKSQQLSGSHEHWICDDVLLEVQATGGMAGHEHIIFSEQVLYKWFPSTRLPLY